MKAILDTRPESGYDDSVEEYHFPNRYLEVARSAEGDWVIYREPRRNGGRAGYVGVARIAGIRRDPERADHAYARISDFLPFDETVPLELNGECFEHRLRDVSRTLRGQALQGKSVRNISEAEFNAIVHAGLGHTLDPENARRYLLTEDDVDAETAAFLQEAPEEQERQIQQVLTNRKIRDASFRRQVCRAYQDTCAVTGLRIINGGGKAEVQAAHLKPVAAGGPDIVQNGVALSATVHWLFDRHLISIDTDYRLLVAHNRVPSELQSLFEQQRNRIRLPNNRRFWPHPAFLQHHVDQFAGVA